ncbi:MAG: tetratricopeptide repeat protein [Prevotella sp.]|nr:tetratricopeptide repeat protein [Prevotella sp.]
MRLNIRYILMVFMAMAFSVASQAQTDRQHVRQGNRLFRQGAYDKAEVEYMKALSKNENNTQATYNLGCSMMMQGKDSAAVVQFQQAGKAEPNKIRRAMAYHNIGVVMQQHQQYAQAIEAYKEALRNNPADNETRYNLELCKRQQKQNQQDQNSGGGEDKKDQNKDDQKKDQNKQNQKDQNKDKDQDQKDQQQDQSGQQQMSKENAQRLLDAAMQEEKRTQDRLQKAMQQPRRKILQKNW